MSNKIAVDAFKQLRVYRRLSFPLILNEIACNRIMKLSSLIAVAPRIYQLSCKIIGKNFVNFIINSTYCKIFTAGNTIREADQASEYFRQQGTFLGIQAFQSFSTTAQRATSTVPT
jgi:hypothetical protein